MNIQCKTHCAACCQQIGKLIITAIKAVDEATEPVPEILQELAEFPYDITETGACSKLDATSKLCNVYAWRPRVCNTGQMYDKYYNGMKPDEYLEMSLQSCMQLRKHLPKG
jgi:Fe-S-cluster containining protein